MAKRGETETRSIPVIVGSGNVFADLGLAEPEGELNRVQLASHIRHAIKRQRLSPSGDLTIPMGGAGGGGPRCPFPVSRWVS
jgi:hypothetical protein